MYTSLKKSYYIDYPGRKKSGDWERNTNEVKEIDVKSIFR